MTQLGKTSENVNDNAGSQLGDTEKNYVIQNGLYNFYWFLHLFGLRSFFISISLLDCGYLHKLHFFADNYYIRPLKKCGRWLQTGHIHFVGNIKFVSCRIFDSITIYSLRTISIAAGTALNSS